MRKMFTKLFSLALFVYCLTTVNVVQAQADCMVITASDVELVTDPTTVCDSADLLYRVVGYPGAQYAFNFDGNVSGGFTSDSTVAVPEGVPFTVQVLEDGTCYSNVLSIANSSVIEPVEIQEPGVQHPLCFGGSGEITINYAGNGGNPYTYYVVKKSVWDANGFPNSDPSAYTVPSTQVVRVPGTYFVAVTDAAGCVDLTQIAAWDTAVINAAPAQLVVDNITATDPTCIGAADGTVSVTVSGGTPDIDGEYEVTVGGETMTTTAGVAVFDLPAGSYEASVIDSFGCEVMPDTTLVLEDPADITFDLYVDDVTCAEGNTGVIYVHTFDGPVGATFSASLGDGVWVAAVNDTVELTALSAGYYSIYVDNTNDLCDSVPYVNPNGTGNVVAVQSPGEIEFTVDAGTITCQGDSTMISVSASGGSGEYEYQLELDGSVDVAFSSVSEWEVGAGVDYVVTVRDVNDVTCEVAGVAFDIDDVSTVDIDAVDEISPTCPGGNDGVIQIYAEGGNGTYEYSIDSVAWYTNNTFAVAAGDYTVYARDPLCKDQVDWTSVTVDALDPNIIGVSAQDTSVECNGAEDGSITVTVGSWASQAGESRTASIYYTTDEGAVYISGTEMEAGVATDDLGPGTYYIWAVDEFGCVFDEDVDGTGDVLTVTITEHDAMVVSGSVTDDATCYGENDGVITIKGAGGSGVGYLYGIANTMQAAVQMDEDAMTTWPTDADSVQVQVGLGTYYVVGYDEGCSSRTYAGPFTVGGKEMVTVVDTAMSVTDIICAGDSVGVIEIFPAEGGTEDFTYTLQVWSGGAWADVEGYVDVTATIYEGLPYGTYKVVVTDLGGCDGAETGNIDVDGPTDVVEIYDYDSEDITCNGASDGTISITADGGTAPYEFKVGTTNWRAFPTGSDEKTIVVTEPGEYEVWIRDSKGCTSESESFIIEQPELLVVELAEKDATVACDDDGELAITVSGGVMGVYPVDYDIYVNDNLEFSHVGWTSGGGTYTLTGLTGGTYDVKVIENHNQYCEAYATAVIDQPDTITASAAVTTEIMCNDEETGVITVSEIMGGNGMYTISIAPALGVQDSNVFSELPAGYYDVTVTDGSCTLVIDSVNVTEPSALALNATKIADITCAEEGSFSIQATGGAGDYKYYTAISILPDHILLPDPSSDAWQDDSIFTVSVAGTYIVWAMDVNGCVIGGEENDAGQPVNAWRVKIADPTTVITYDSWSENDPLCNGDLTAMVIVDNVVVTKDGVAVTSPDYTTTINGVVIDNDTLANVGAGMYYIEVMDAEGCSTLDTVEVEEPDVLEAVLVVGDGEFTCSDVVEGYLEVNVDGGTEDYQYELWQDGVLKTASQSDNSFLVRINHSYTVVVMDDNGCTDTTNTIILDPIAEVVITAVNNISCYGDIKASATIHATGEPGRMLSVKYMNIDTDTEWTEVNEEFESNSSITLSELFDFDAENIDDKHYAIVVVDDMGCESTPDTVTFDYVQTELVLSTDLGEATECTQDITVDVGGGTAPYTIMVNDSVLTGTTYTAGRGEYVVAVYDEHGCTKSETIVVEGTYVVREATIETYIDEETAFVDAEAGIDTMLAVGSHEFVYTLDCERTLNVEVIEIPRPYTIAEVQGEGEASPIEGKIAQVSGRITAIAEGEGFFVQDANTTNSGLWVEYSDVTGMSVGDDVVVVGKVAEIANVTSIQATSVTLTTDNFVITPMELTPTAAQDEMYESMLVVIMGGRATAADAGNGEWSVYYEPTDVITVNDWLYSSTPVEGNYFNVTGIVNARLDAFKLEPRMASDVVDITATDAPIMETVEFSVYPNPFNDVINVVNHDKLTRVVISNIAGQRVIDVAYPNSEIRTGNLVSGIYVVSMFTENGIAKTEKIIKK